MSKSSLILISNYYLFVIYIHSVEYNISYVYHSIFSYFDRDNVALPGLAHFFKEMSLEEREHAEKMMQYQTTRGGKVQLGAIHPPESEFFHKNKVIYSAFELVLILNKGRCFICNGIVIVLGKIKLSKIERIMESC